ncbi:MAG: hypothetical protein EAZ51_06350 [Sphingobacteriales bacterium]|nr:MAG: hypothetical protein EAZ64_06130 [Sphingobacteriales bacterium]TAF80233.1 MAG: hypothetical protein EAZ51_06350 [Sphingobacteriales bacterium]
MATHDKIDGFTVPNDYFDTLPSRINTHIFITKLNESKLASGFTTPNLYFDNLEIKLSHLAKTNYHTPKALKISPLYISKYAAAACILLVTSVGVFINTSYQSKTQNLLTSVSNEEIELFLQNETNTADMPLIIENVENTYLQVNKSISNKDLNDYLNEPI